MPSDDSVSSQGLAKQTTRDLEIARRDPEIASARTEKRDLSTSSEDPATSLYTKWRIGRSDLRWRKVANRTSRAGILATLALILNIVLAALLVYYVLHLKSRIPKNDIERIVRSWGKPGSVTQDRLNWPTDFSRDVKPIPCHSHNDYWRRVPLFDALAAGCTGVEADVWLRDGDLLVGHSKGSLTSSRTLRTLYIDPLIGILARQNPDSELDDNERRQGIFETSASTPLTLLIDIKSDPASTWPLIIDQLEPLRRRGFLTHFNGSDLVTGLVTVVGTGNTKLNLIASKETNPHGDIFFDAPLDELWGDGEKSTNASRYTAENSYYASVSFAGAIGSPWLGVLKPSQVDIIRGQVQEATKRGLKARYWDTPTWPIGLRDHIWDILVREGVGMLSVDDVDGAAKRDWGTM